jgi:hypothetical protein
MSSGCIEDAWNNCHYFPFMQSRILGRSPFHMPIIRYFMFAGGLLAAVLFLADYFLPAAPEPGAGVDVDRTVIRIHSMRALPERIVFDTSESERGRSPLQVDTGTAAEDRESRMVSVVSRK